MDAEIEAGLAAIVWAAHHNDELPGELTELGGLRRTFRGFMCDGVVAITVDPSGVSITGEDHAESGGLELQHDLDESDRILLIPSGVLGYHVGSITGWLETTSPNWWDVHIEVVNQCVKVSQQQAHTRTYFT
jgi:hypothetical protein